jgi:hypothetical protein
MMMISNVVVVARFCEHHQDAQAQKSLRQPYNKKFGGFWTEWCSTDRPIDDPATVTMRQVRPCLEQAGLVL